MRKLLILPVLLAVLSGSAALPGCNSRPDPREREDFKDTSDPDAVFDMLPKTEEGAKGPGPGMGP